MNVPVGFLFAIQAAIDLVRFQSVTRDLIAKGITVAQIKGTILASGIPLLPEVHNILVKLERDGRERGANP
jgi:multisubunit Na+/H+ antiporter MnhG subunit